MKTKAKFLVRRFVVFTLMLAAGVAALILLMCLLRIASLSIRYSEALASGYANRAKELFEVRLAIGNGTGLTSFLYNLPFVAKLLITLISSGIVSFVSYFFYIVIKATCRKILFSEDYNYENER